MNRSFSESQLRAFAKWLDEPLTPGLEKELNNWLAEEHANQEAWDTWKRINGRAKRLQVIPSNVNTEWAILRDEMGFKHSRKDRYHSRSGSQKKDFYKQPAVVAVLSMIVFSLFLFLLHMIRAGARF